RCDAVDVCIPTDLHVQIGLKVIAAGKALLIEKPLAQNFEEAMKLYEASEQVGVPFMVGHVARFFPEIKRAHDLVADGLIGNPGVARSRRGGLA
ncbi:Gfo/Idh/MocA family protein, partial [Clostridium perfringens]|uniref:Gfo/Idh/MocA family protein n=1 Tax=Clostridium perfringens TaxID=1502 RepID=UPI003754C6EA